MKSNVSSGRVLPHSGSTGCRPQIPYYNSSGLNYSVQQAYQQQHQHQNVIYHQQYPHGQPQNYAMLHCFSQHSTNGWAGIPLISTAASTNRRLRKQCAPTMHSTTSSTSCHLLHMYNSNRECHANDQDLNPMTRLALHAQGAPLLLAGTCNRNRMNFVGNRQIRSSHVHLNDGRYSCSYKTNGTPLSSSSHQKSKENCNNSGLAVVTNNNNSNDSAVACLPRIIKPRKRRKKDRKPLSGTTSFVKVDNEPEAAITNMPKPMNFIEKQQQHPPHAVSFNYETQCNLKTDDNLVDNQNPVDGSICFCRQCDPVSRIWAFPLRQTNSEHFSDTLEFEAITKNVGVIGSNRSNQTTSPKKVTVGGEGNLSVFNDSASIAIIKDFFDNNSNESSKMLTTKDLFDNNYLDVQKLPTDLLLSPTAESLLTESINEISRKLMETCDIKSVIPGTTSPGSASSISDNSSVFSDSGVSIATSNHPCGDDLIFNFKNLTMNSDTSPSIMFTRNDSIFDCFTTPDVNNNLISSTNASQSPTIDPIYNCLDLLWSTATSSTDQTTAPAVSPSSSSSTLYRPAVAST